jgi:hypothetical protein
LQRLGLTRGSQLLARVDSASGTLFVRDHQGFREMVARDGNSELVWTRVALKDSTVSGWPYVELFHLAPALARQCTRALFIGCGGGVGVRQATARPTTQMRIFDGLRFVGQRNAFPGKRGAQIRRRVFGV